MSFALNHQNRSQRTVRSGTDRRAHVLEMRRTGPGQDVLRRKEGQCACGGGCPRCTTAALQRKAQVSTPGDRFEREADAVADQVMRMPDPMVQRQCKGCPDASAPSPIDEEEPQIQRQANGEGGTGEVASDFTSRLGAWAPLDTASRSYFEPRFGRDFGNVRVHTGTSAAESARSIGAVAYTVGPHIVFGTGRYAPQTAHGRRLLHMS